MKRLLFFFLLSALGLTVMAQNNAGVLKGRVVNQANNEPVAFANVVIWNSTTGMVTDSDGRFRFANLAPGFLHVQVSSIGYETYTSEAILVTNAREAVLMIALVETSIDLEAVTVRPSTFRKSEESPVSLRNIGIDEIEKNPGGNRDISRIIQSFPGVASSPAFRNDIIVRGGGPSENRFFLDGVEIPNLNHFSTQGASGGPVGIINVDFLREADFYSGAFPASRGNAMSSMLDMKQKDGNTEAMKFRATIGASDLALTVDGPLSQKTTMIASLRRSYLQLLFSALDLPFLPTYNDFQFKVKTRLDAKNELTFIGLGALDQFELNLDANETEEQRYILGYLPVNEQWNYTLGVVYKHYREKGYYTLVLSQNKLNNNQYKYRDNVETPENLILDYDSYELETKLRFESHVNSTSGFKFTYGAELQDARYFNQTFRKRYDQGVPFETDYRSKINFIKYGLFGQVSGDFIANKLQLSLGIRADGASYDDQMNNLLKQISPRFSASFQLTPGTSLNFNTGRYYQLPAYTTMGYLDAAGVLVNKNNGLRYIAADHVVGGIEFQPSEKTQLTVEGFYKNYRHYPLSVTDSVSLASKGADYGTYGDEEVYSTSKGHAYGFEVLARAKDLLGISAVAAYTYVRSEFTNKTSTYIPSSWDNRHLVTLTATRGFKKNWDLGLKWRYVGGAPYTPWDLERSAVKEAWDARGAGYLDYSKFNESRLEAFHQLDLRVDKAYYYKTWSLMFYFDIQNAYGFTADEADYLIRVEDEYDQPVTDPNDSGKYLLKTLESSSGTVLPTIGIMVEF